MQTVRRHVTFERLYVGGFVHLYIFLNLIGERRTLACWTRALAGLLEKGVDWRRLRACWTRALAGLQKKGVDERRRQDSKANICFRRSNAQEGAGDISLFLSFGGSETQEGAMFRRERGSGGSNFYLCAIT